MIDNGGAMQQSPLAGRAKLRRGRLVENSHPGSLVYLIPERVLSAT